MKKEKGNYYTTRILQFSNKYTYFGVSFFSNSSLLSGIAHIGSQILRVIFNIATKFLIKFTLVPIHSPTFFVFKFLSPA